MALKTSMMAIKTTLMAFFVYKYSILNKLLFFLYKPQLIHSKIIWIYGSKKINFKYTLVQWYSKNKDPTQNNELDSKKPRHKLKSIY